MSSFQIGLACLLLAISGCKFFFKNPRNEASQAKSTNSISATGDLIDEFNVDQQITQPGNIVVAFTVRSPTPVPTGGAVSINLSISHPSLNVAAQISLKTSVILNGTPLIVDQVIPNDPYSWNASGNFKLKVGDLLEVTIKDVPQELVDGNFYAFASFQKEGIDNVSDRMSGSGAYSFDRSDLASSATHVFSATVPIPAAAPYDLSVNVTGRVLTTTQLHTDTSGDLCANINYSGTAKAVYKRAGRAETFDLPDLGSANCTATFGNSILLEQGDAVVSAEVRGAEKDKHFLTSGLDVNSPLGGFPNSFEIASEPVVALGQPMVANGSYLVGVISKKFIVIKLAGVKKKTGLKLMLSGNFYYPANSPAAMKSTFDGNGVVAKLTKAGKPVLTNTGAETVFVLQSGAEPDRAFLYWDEASFPDIADEGGPGDYAVQIEVPDSLIGVYANFSISPERLVDFLEPLDPALIADFAARDAKHPNVTVHDWQKPDYSAREGEVFSYEANASGAAEPIAMTEVLKAMEEVRDAFHLTANEVNPFSKQTVVKTSLNEVDRGSIEGCLGNEAKHWSDLAIHYYCLHSKLRGCYTSGVRSTGEYMQSVKAEEGGRGPKTADELNTGVACRLPTMQVQQGKFLPVAPNDLQFRLPTLRSYVYARCSADSKIDFPDTTGPTNTIPGCENRKDVFSYAPESSRRESFSWLLKDGGNTARHARIFRYLMDAPTFAFDAQMQQDVINSFWRVKNPSDPVECAKRPLRVIDPQDGTHCLVPKSAAKSGQPGKVQNPELWPANR